MRLDGYVLDADVVTVLAESTRRAVLDLLADGDRTAGELAAAVPGLTHPAVYRQLRVLRDAGLVRVRVAGKRRVHRLDAHPLSDVERWLSRYERHRTSALDRLTGHPTTDPGTDREGPASWASTAAAPRGHARRSTRWTSPQGTSSAAWCRRTASSSGASSRQ